MATLPALAAPDAMMKAQSALAAPAAQPAFAHAAPPAAPSPARAPLARGASRRDARRSYSCTAAAPTREHERLRDSEARVADWKALGPYVMERAWGSVREDYSADGDAWRSFPHEHARSRAYRWCEDGLAGVCNRFQNVVLHLALWNGRDPILKERLFGLSNAEGNHGEDVKEVYAYVDSTPTHSFTKMRYFYPIDEYPYAALVAESARRSRTEREFELVDAIGAERWAAGAFWDVTVEYAKASPTELVCRVAATNASAAPAELHILPHLVFRNTWSWGYDESRPRIEERDSDSPRVAHAAAYERHLGAMRWAVSVPESSGGVLTQPVELLLTDNETNFKRLYGDVDNIPPGSTHKKDAFHTHVTGDNAYGAPGAVSTVMPRGAAGTKAAVWTVQEVPPGGTAEVLIRFAIDGGDGGGSGSGSGPAEGSPAGGPVATGSGVGAALLPPLALGARRAGGGATLAAGERAGDDNEDAWADDDEDDEDYAAAAAAAPRGGDGRSGSASAAGSISRLAGGDGRLSARSGASASDAALGRGDARLDVDAGGGGDGGCVRPHPGDAPQPPLPPSPRPLRRGASLRRSGVGGAATARGILAASYDDDVSGAFSDPTASAGGRPVRADLQVTGNVYRSPAAPQRQAVAAVAAADTHVHVVGRAPLMFPSTGLGGGALPPHPAPASLVGSPAGGGGGGGGSVVSATFQFGMGDVDDAGAPAGASPPAADGDGGGAGVGGHYDASVASGMFGMTRQLSFHSDGHHGDFHGEMSTATLLGVNAASLRLAATGARRRAVGASALAAAARTAAARAHDARGPLRFDDVRTILALRAEEADEFYAAVQAPGLSADDAAIQRQAFAGLLFSKCFYHYGVDLWLKGDPAFPAPPKARLTGRNCRWRHLYANDVLSLPDAFEYNWPATWDLAFHVIPIAMVDAEWAKRQLVLLMREWYMAPNGAMPAYEWDLGDLNPPVHAWACWRVYQITRNASGGVRDLVFLERCFHKLMLNFAYFANKKDVTGNSLFEGGFLGMDNVSPFDRSTMNGMHGARLEQADATAWMGMFAGDMLTIAIELATHVSTAYEDVCTKFLEHFMQIAESINRPSAEGGLYDPVDRFFYDHLALPDGSRRPVKVRSFVGLIPLFASLTIDERALRRLPGFAARLNWALKHSPLRSVIATHHHPPLPGRGRDACRLLSLVTPDQLPGLLARVLSEAEFLSPHGVRSLSKEHEAHPVDFAHGAVHSTLRYEAGESTSGLFGGNSNWRGPVWMPVNFLLIERLQVLDRYYGDTLTVEVPTGSGVRASLWGVAAELSQRLISLFRRDPATGVRPQHGANAFFSTHPRFRDLVPFYEYMNGDTGEGLGSPHQTGWTALVAKLLQQQASHGRGGEGV